MIKIKCNRCGETSLTSIYERIGERHGFSAKTMMPCGGIFEQVGETPADKKLVAYLKEVIK